MTDQPTPTNESPMIPMPPGSVPDLPAVTRVPCRIVRVGPPPGQEQHVEATEMLHSRTPLGDIWCSYVKPTAEQLEVLNDGGYIELVQWTPQVVPFALAVWRGDGA